MKPRLTTHLLYEWVIDGVYYSQIVNRQDSLVAFPDILEAQEHGLVHTTPVWYNHYREIWVLLKGGRLTLPYNVQLDKRGDI